LIEQGLRDSVDQPVLNWRFRLLRAESYTRKGTPAEVAKLLAGDLPPGAPAELAWRRYLIQGFADCQMRNYRDSQDHFAKSAQFAGASEPQHAEITYFRARCQFLQRELEQAAAGFRQVSDVPSVDEFVRGWSFYNLGSALSELHRYEDAVGPYEKARAAFVALQARGPEEQALGNLGYVYSELGDLPHAKEASEAAVKMAEELKLTGDEQRWLLNLAAAQDSLREYAAAEANWKKALAIPIPPGTPKTALICLHNLTRLAISQKRIAEAEKYHQEEGRRTPKDDELIDWRLDDARISEVKGDYKAAEDVLHQLLVESEALPPNQGPGFRKIRAMQIQLARVLAAQKKDAEAVVWFEKSIATIKQAADAMKTDHARITLLSNTPVFDDYVAFLVERGLTAEALRMAQQGRAWTLARGLGVLTSNQNPTQWLARIQSSLRPQKATVLSYFLTDNESYLWVVTPAKTQVFKLGTGAPAIEDLIDRYRGEIKSHLSIEASSAARRLYQILVQPASSMLLKDSRVIVVGDSRLYDVNFEALVSEQTGLHYWIDDVAVENVSSLDLWMAGAKQQKATAKGLLVIGASVQADPRFPALPNAPKEMENVARNFDGKKIKKISGSDATREAYLSNSPGEFKYIYIAAHGISDPVDPMASAIILSPDGAGNYRLLAREIIGKKLNADLVTISACEGAGTNLQSLEGLLGLEWAFLRAGAHRVVAGLWDVDDASTPGFMNDFYRDLMHGQDAVDALRNAKKAMLHSSDTVHAHPYYWASLQLYTGA
jgi:CHAT domain-containing protein